MLAFALTGCATEISIQPTGKTSATATPSTAPSPRPVLTTPGFCASAFPHLVAAQEQVSTFVKHTDGSKTDTVELEGVIDDLKHDESLAPTDLKPKVAAIRKPLEQFHGVLTTQVDTTIDLQDYRSVGLDLITICAPYAGP